MQFREIDENFIVMLKIDSLKFIVENLYSKIWGLDSSNNNKKNLI